MGLLSIHQAQESFFTSPIFQKQQKPKARKQQCVPMTSMGAPVFICSGTCVWARKTRVMSERGQLNLGTGARCTQTATEPNIGWAPPTPCTRNLISGISHIQHWETSADKREPTSSWPHNQSRIHNSCNSLKTILWRQSLFSRPFVHNRNGWNESRRPQICALMCCEPTRPAGRGRAPMLLRLGAAPHKQHSKSRCVSHQQCSRKHGVTFHLGQPSGPKRHSCLQTGAGWQAPGGPHGHNYAWM